MYDCLAVGLKRKKLHKCCFLEMGDTKIFCLLTMYDEVVCENFHLINDEFLSVWILPHNYASRKLIITYNFKS